MTYTSMSGPGRHRYEVPLSFFFFPFGNLATFQVEALDVAGMGGSGMAFSGGCAKEKDTQPVSLDSMPTLQPGCLIGGPLTCFSLDLPLAVQVRPRPR